MSNFQNLFNDVILNKEKGLGLSYREAAHFFGVVDQTIERWAVYHTEPMATVWIIVRAIKDVLERSTPEQKERIRKGIQQEPADRLGQLIKAGLILSDDCWR